MENELIISVSALKIKLQELNGELRKLEEKKGSILEEKRHIEYVIDNCAMKPMKIQGKMQSAIPTNDGGAYSIPESKFDRIQSIVDVLKDNGKPMKSVLIRQELERRGTPIPRNSFDSIMSVESRRLSSQIKKAGYGKYRHEEIGGSDAPSEALARAGAKPSTSSHSNRDVGAI